MQAFLYLLPLLASFAFSSVTPSRALEPRQDSECGQFSTISSGSFTVGADEWGASSGTGSQCAEINGLNDGSLAWDTTWTWSDGPSNVKSFTNVVSSSTSCQELSSIGSIPTSWSWSYSGSGVRANVVYDTFLGSSCSGAQDYEVMVWLGTFGAVDPLSNNGYPPTPTASPTIGDYTFNLVIGTEGSSTVYSFVAVSNITNFSGNLINFYSYLETNQGLPSDYYVQSIAAGTEVFTGSDAELSTSSYTISMG
ncbi:MAG: hypothetical protein ASARMPREDX12_007004 [Alectoria sarmentosa]|nr:MAG: hypothetical protein ASARMPRED_004766 [Alectoria sarmentosa]CAD6593271.1 MAG: hypothetical protein ASARMPREDX12_007004 [Alectoria sarmentosa]